MDILEKVINSLEEQKAVAMSNYSTLISAKKKIVTPSELSQYASTFKQLDSLKKQASMLRLEFDYDIVSREKEEYKQKAYKEYLDKSKLLEDELNRKINEIEADVASKVEANNQNVKDEFEKGNKVYIDLESKRAKLEEYSDFIVSQCANCGITSSDVLIDNNSYKLDEWNSIYDTAFDYIQKHGGNFNPITKIREILHDEKVEVLFVLGLLFISLTTILNFIGVIFFLFVVYGEFTYKGRVKQCAVLLGLLYNVRPLEMGYSESIDESKLLNEDEEVDNDERTEALMAWYEEESTKLDNENPDSYIDEEFAKVTTGLTDITEKYEAIAKKFNADVSLLIEEIDKVYSSLQEKYEYEKSQQKKLGDMQSESLVYNPRYLLGLKDDCIPEYVNTGLQNIVIRPSDDEELQKRFIQAMIVNAFCNVKPLAITITIVDPNNRGKDVIGFRSDELDNNFKIEQRKMSEIVATFDEVAKKNMEMLRGIDIQTYNKEAEETGKTPIDYNVILVLSGAEKKEDNEELTEFMSYSASMGIFVWVITPLKYKNCYEFKKPFDGVQCPYEFDTLRFPITFGNVMGKRIKTSKPKGLGWGDYLARAFKEPDDFWALSGNEFIWIEPGFVEGDPSRPDHYTLGNTGDVHGVIAGTSGSGKSVYINHLIATMTKRYSPKDLELWLVDFKGSEFSFYLKTENTPKTLPHIKACLCTSDPEYSKSLFRALREMADARYNKLKEMQLKNMVQYNELMEKNGTPELKWPRVIMINDEFQVIYTKADAKTIDSVNQDIILLSKVARACGVHLIFASQSMKGTISNDTLAMFTLRMCLRCEVEVSQQILGTPYAGQIRQKNGYLYVGSIDDAKKELQKRFKTPWAPDDMLRAHIDRCYDEAIKTGYKYDNVIEYNENTKHSVNEINGVYDSVKENGKLPESGTVFLGRLMVYSKNKAPENLILTPANAENIYGCFMDNADYVNFFLSFKRNIDLWNIKPQVIYNSQSDDYHYLCHLDEYVPKKLQKLSTAKTSIKEMVDVFTKMVDVRKQNNIKDVPLIFVCMGWAAAVGFGIEPDGRLIDKLSVMLQTAGEYNIHWVFLDQSKGSVGTSILKACKYRVCGKVDEQTANALCDTAIPSRPTELKNGYAWLYARNELSKFKIYQSELDRQVKEVKVVI